MNEFLGRLALTVLCTLLIKGCVALAGHSIEWWIAGLISLVIVFGGFLILDGDVID